MSIEQVENLEPYAFLERVKETPYSPEEKSLYIAAIVGAALADVANYFLRPIYTLSHSCTYLFNYLPIEKDEKLLLLTLERIKKTFNDKNNSTILESKLTHIVETTERLSKNMGLGKVAVVLSNNEERSDATLATYNTRLIILNTTTTNLSNEAIEFLIAHELAHFQHHDALKGLIFEWVVLVLNLVAFRYFTVTRAIGVGMLTRLISTPVELSVRIYNEWAADEKALLCLNSNKGMVDFFYHELKRLYTFKHTAPEEIQKKNPTLKIEKIENAQEEITPHGNDTNDLTHPPLTERLAHALNFNPHIKDLLSKS